MFLQRLRIPQLDISRDLTVVSSAIRRLSREGFDSDRFLSYAAKIDDLPNLRRVADGIRTSFKNVVVLATGGSALGAKAVIQACGNGKTSNPANPRMYFEDNLSAHTMDALLRALDLRRTHFLVISKSGKTMETLSQFLVFLDAVKAVAGTTDISRHFTVVTEPGDNPLRHCAEVYGLVTFDHDPKLDGRYSVFSIVGALPALIFGLDPALMREGAEAVLDRVFHASNVRSIPSAMGAAVNYHLAMEAGCSCHVMMIYEPRLADFAQWHRQLWSESLGKDGYGTTPIVALGPVDQHSQLQLYLDGPEDKFFTILTSNASSGGPMVPETETTLHPDLGYLAKQRIGDIVAAEANATSDSLIDAGRPVRRITLADLDEKNMGALLMHFMLETLFTAHLYGISPYGQPAVEQGKKLALATLAQSRSVKLATRRTA